MAAPVAGYFRDPDDTGYAGVSPKKVHTQSRVVGSDTVHEHQFVKDRFITSFGTYEAVLAQQTYSATATDGTSTGYLWAHMPSAVSNRSARIRRIYLTAQYLGSLAISAPRVRIDRMTFTGTATGATVQPMKSTTQQASQAFDLRTAVTGLTVTLAGGALGTLALGGMLSGIAAWSPPLLGISELAAQFSEDDEWTLLKPGEGLSIYQDVAGTAADTRKFNIGIVWDEIDTA